MEKILDQAESGPFEMQSKTLKHGIHALTAGQGAALVLLPGWPQTAEAFAELLPHLSGHFEVWVLDPPGLGDSRPSAEGYNTKTISRILAESIEDTVKTPYHLVGHDIGAWIAFAWAVQFSDRLSSLTLLDSAVPGHAPPLSYPLPAPANIKLWQFSFNSLPDLPEILTKGKERELLDWLFDRKAQHPERITQAKRDRYTECYSRPGAMTQGFEYYRAVATSAAQNKESGEKCLNMPVLALGGESAVGSGLKTSMEKLAHNVRGGEIADCGHYIPEEQPEELALRMLEFLQGL
ncbi:hypothetical protein PRZ48_012419 [Zasmidium cellare]|uniref:AB hydrolase-1 domain-containing protein n=1 Tax=Zasmidium cellare TaxID=395010 RepID=A0ABR0E536_ZASCE|nr:hypothetical protein PRZ48_012419 [Zasmidium cellare]